eukprot:14512354-Alexandrium_andersonii.AAC.1
MLSSAPTEKAERCEALASPPARQAEERASLKAGNKEFRSVFREGLPSGPSAAPWLCLPCSDVLVFRACVDGFRDGGSTSV